MYVGNVSEAFDTEHLNKSPPFPDPLRALNVSIHTRDADEIVNKIIVPISPAILMLFTDHYYANNLEGLVASESKYTCEIACMFCIT